MMVKQFLIFAFTIWTVEAQISANRDPSVFLDSNKVIKDAGNVPAVVEEVDTLGTDAQTGDDNHRNLKTVEDYTWAYTGSKLMEERRQKVATITIAFCVFFIIFTLLMKKMKFASCSEHMRTHVNEIKAELTLPRMVVVILGCLATIVGVSTLTAGEFHYTQQHFDVGSLADCKTVCNSKYYAQCETVKFTTTKQEAKPYNYQMFDTQANGKTNKQDTMKLTRMMCTYEVFPVEWQPYFVSMVTILGIVMVVEGAPADIVFMCASILFGLVGIISANDVFAGLSGGAVVSIGLLMVIGAAISETGWLDIVVSQILGTSPLQVVGLSRMASASAVLSMFLPNAPLFMLVSPVVQSWARRFGFSKKKLLAPIGIALQVGGQCTMLGSSTPMVAKLLYPAAVYDLQMFGLTPIGGLTAIVMLIAAILFVPLLPGDEAEVHVCNHRAHRDASGHEGVELERATPVLSNAKPQAQKPIPEKTKASLYVITLVVDTGGIFDGLDAHDACAQISRFPGVLRTFPVNANAQKFAAGAKLVCNCMADGVVNLRKCRGLTLDNVDDLHLLGPGRRHRFLYEAIVSHTSPLVGKQLDTTLFRNKYKSGVVAIRGKALSGSVIADGDTLLLETAKENLKEDEPWNTCFSLLRLVPGSSPPRSEKEDYGRCAFVFACFIAMVGVISADLVPTSLAAAAVVVVFLLFKVVSVDQVFDAIKSRALLIIAGSMGLASALQNAGVVTYLSNAITKATLGNVNLMRSAVYVLTATLSQIVSKPCTMAIVGPMLPAMAEDAGASLESFIFLGIFAAGACFITPFGEPASIFVVQDGEYSMADFGKYGIPLQIVHGIVTILLLTWFYD